MWIPSLLSPSLLARLLARAHIVLHMTALRITNATCKKGSTVADAVAYPSNIMCCAAIHPIHFYRFVHNFDGICLRLFLLFFFAVTNKKKSNAEAFSDIR